MRITNERIENSQITARLLQKYEFGLKMLESELDILIQEFEYKHKYNPVEHTKSRIKSVDSIINKLESKGYDPTIFNMINHVHDIVGIRIICSFITDVYDIVNMIIASKEIKVIERKDYIAEPKDSGYSSYHLIVLVPIYLSTGIEYIEAEIQVRTVTMDFWASLDHKIRYKFSGTVPDEVQEEMMKYSKAVKEIDNKMLDLNDLINQYKEKE